MHSLLRKHHKIKLSLLFLFIISFTIFFNIIAKDRNNKIDIALQTDLKNLEIHHSLVLDYFYTDAKTIQSKVMNDPTILNLVKNSYNKSLPEQKNNREELYKHLLPFYERIKARGVLQFQFMFPNNTTFLRMHKPTKFDDDLSKVRYSYTYANEAKKITYGFEQGRTTHAIRYVFPLFDQNNNHIGAAEVGLSTKYIQDRLVNSNKIYTHYIVNRKIFDVRAWKEPGKPARYLPSVEHDDYIYAVSLHNTEKNLREKQIKYIKDKKSIINEKFETKEPFSIYLNAFGDTKILSFVPIKNIKDKEVVAYIVSHTNSIRVENILRDCKFMVMTGFVLLVLFFYFIYTILSHKETLEKEVDTKTKKLRVLNENLEKKIAKEVEKNKKAQEQIYKADKMIAIGEMIENIAHHWRQPLSVISTAISGLKLEHDYGKLDADKINKTYEAITDNTEYLSTTINNFRDFITKREEKKEFIVNDSLENFFHLVEGSIEKENLNVIIDINETITMHGYSYELIQCLVNIFNNSKDALKNTLSDKYIFINIVLKEKKVIITLKDNGGGVDEDILPRIFEPYYTTKHKSQGTGLGLSSTYSMITQNMNGSIEAVNVTFEYNKKTYSGLETTITLPLK